jgi:hypothetical protein
VNLTPLQRKQLHNALVEAFPTWNDLRLFTDLELGVNLATISTEQNLNTAILELIYWAIAGEHLFALIDAMCTARPDNSTVLSCRKLLNRSLTGPTNSADPLVQLPHSASQIAWASTSVTLISASLTIPGSISPWPHFYRFLAYIRLVPPSGSPIELHHDSRVRLIINTITGQYVEEVFHLWYREVGADPPDLPQLMITGPAEISVYSSTVNGDTSRSSSDWLKILGRRMTSGAKVHVELVLFSQGSATAQICRGTLKYQDRYNGWELGTLHR